MKECKGEEVLKGALNDLEAKRRHHVFDPLLSK